MSNPVEDLKRELLAAAERQHQPAPGPIKERRFRHAPMPRLLPIGAAVAVAAAAALFLTAPWTSSPGLLAKAAAALTVPPGRILHEKWTEVQHGVVPNGRTCTGESAGEFWIDEPTNRFRAVMRDGNAPYPHPPTWAQKMKGANACKPGLPPAYEIGGHVLGTGGFQFVPPNRLGRIAANVIPFGGGPYDPAETLRHALRSGHARDLGRTKLNGRTVELITERYCLLAADGPGSTCVRRGADRFYVDPKTFYPIEAVTANSTKIIRFAAYEYLPRTSGNLALTNIRAQHPHARISG
jgi:hypothetical protein